VCVFLGGGSYTLKGLTLLCLAADVRIASFYAVAAAWVSSILRKVATDPHLYMCLGLGHNVSWLRGGGGGRRAVNLAARQCAADQHAWSVNPYPKPVAAWGCASGQPLVFRCCLFLMSQGHHLSMKLLICPLCPRRPRL
jgi:hypothetical protein